MAPKSLADALSVLDQLSPEDRIKAVLSYRQEHDRRFWSAFVEKQVKLRDIQTLSPHKTLVTFEFRAERFYCNNSGNLHGGAQATMFDICTSLAIQALGKPGFWLNAGVSRILSVTYVRPALEGTDLLIECEVVHMGQKLAVARALMKRADDGAVISTCEHNKAAVVSKPGWGKL